MCAKNNIKGKSMPLSIITGVGVSLILTLVGASIAAMLLTAERIGIQAITACTIITAAVSVAGGAWAASILAGKRRIQVCLITGGGYFLVLLAMTALLFGGSYEKIHINLLTILLASGVVGFAGLRGMRRSKAKQFQKTYR